MPAAAQQRPQQPAQPAQPAQPGAAPDAPAAPTGPQPGPNTFVVGHTLTNNTAIPVQVVIRTDKGQLFSGLLEGRRANAPADEPSPEISPVVAFEVPKEETLFWEVVYTDARQDDPGVVKTQAEKAKPKKFCRQAWTAVVAPGSETANLLVPVQPVNQFGNCDFVVKTDEDAVFGLNVALQAPPA